MTAQPDETHLEGSVRSFDFELQPAADGFTLEGYAAVFDSPTRISNLREGDFTEVIKPGAFARAVRANPKPQMQFDHGNDPAIGGNPVGVINSMREDDRGLFVSAEMLDTWQAEPVRVAVGKGAITGMSFRFTVPEGGDTWSDDRETRTISDVDVHELGPVVWPAYTDTTVGVRVQQIADTIVADDTFLSDLSVGLLLANHAERTDTPDSPTPDDEDAAPDEEVESFVVAVDEPKGVRVANPAKHATAVMAVRTDLATQRSRLATHELPNRRGEVN